jgi:hypothetical protein
MKDIHAYTEPGTQYPGYLSLNEIDGKFTLTVRTAGNGGRTQASIEVPGGELLALADAIKAKVPSSE